MMFIQDYGDVKVNDTVIKDPYYEIRPGDKISFRSSCLNDRPEV